jgi:hypothetical protein
MPKQPANPISPDLAAAFGDALANFHAWRPGEGEPTVGYNGGEYTISSVCDFVMNHDDPMPEGLISLLNREKHVGVESADFKADNSYRNGGRFLQKLIAYRREEFAKTRK